MKKIILILLLLLLIPVHGFSLTYKVQKVAGTSATVTGGVLSLPSYVQSSAGNAAWVPLAITASSFIPYLGPAIQIGVAVGGAYAIQEAAAAFFGDSAVKDGQIGTSLNSWPTNHSGYVCPTATCRNVGYYEFDNDAYVAVNTATESDTACHYYSGRSAVTESNGYKRWQKSTTCGAPTHTIVGYYTPVGTPEPPDPFTTFTPKTAGEITTALNTGVQAGDFKALDLLKKVLDEVNKNLTGSSDKLKSAMPQVSTALDASVSAAQKTAIDGTPSKSVAEIGALQDAADAAAKTAQDAAKEEESGTMPEDIVPLVPDKLSLTTVMGNFMTSVNALPVIATLRGLTVNCSGSSQLCLTMPVKLGGTICYDASGMQDTLNMLGSGLLSIVTLFSFIAIFRG